MQGLLAFKRYYDFSGRSSRAEYWQFMAIVVGAYILSAILGGMSEVTPLPMLTVLVMIGTIVPTYAATIRRLHDRDITGWAVGVIWILNGISYTLADAVVRSAGNPLLLWLSKVAAGILVLYSLALLYPLVMPGDAKANNYGPPPASAGETLEVHPEVNNPASPSTAEDRLSQIERLAKLHHDGILTDAEFEQQKAALLQ
ncbi:DUF805 domain-containing protein [Sphingobium sp. CAP-1]|uniref:DUF805 domain-containing protein n=1 Tax=Sphingobium sp. CAP-1 TaxID=2676077 RepID=UPI0012BB2945|nr:DUF805 domain-containing protein [Sphingobium sp. CAP-1]QGP80312.1 DUF805 domain-containing protein [Sphingobium sp. CAP-1]